MKAKARRPARHQGARLKKDIDAALAQLAQAELIKPLNENEPAFFFKHALVQDSAYTSLLKGDHKRLHLLVAHAYEKIYADRCMDEYAARLAQHYAEAGDDPKILLYAVHAGDLAASAYANAEAIALYTLAFDAAKRLNAANAQFIHLYTKRGRAYELAGDYTGAVENYREMQRFAQARGDRAFELESLILQTTAYATGLGKVRDPQKAQENSMEALALADELEDRRAQARIYWNLLLNNRFGNEGPVKAVEYGEKSLALASELGLTEQIALTLKDLAVAYVVVGKIDAAVANVPKLIALWRQLNNMPMLAEVIGGSSQFYFAQGNLSKSIEMGEESYRLNRSIDNNYGLTVTGAFLWYSYRELGQLKQAIETAEESIALGEKLKFYGPNWGALVELASTFDWLGDYARAVEFAQRALAGADPNTSWHPVLPSAVLANIALHQGDRAQAEQWLAPFSISALEQPLQMNPIGRWHTISSTVELALAQGDARRALTIAADALATMRKWKWEIGVPSMLHFQAQAQRMMNRTDEAHPLLDEAVQRAEAMQSRYRLLPILLTLIEMETERDDAQAAHKARTRAREIIEYVAAHTPDEYRKSFLNLPRVREVMA